MESEEAVFRWWMNSQQLFHAVGYASRWVRSTEAAEDLVMDALLEALKQWRHAEADGAWPRDEAAGREQFRRYVWANLIYLLRGDHRKNQRRQALAPAVALEPDKLERIPEPRRENEAALLRLDLKTALATLPERQRRAVVLVDGEGLSYEEAARLEGCTPAAINSRLNRARHTMREALGGQAD